jgi:hypothetical protein
MRLPACLHLLVLAGHVVLSQVMMRWMQCDCLPASTCQHLLVLAGHVVLSQVMMRWMQCDCLPACMCQHLLVLARHVVLSAEFLYDSLRIWAMFC